MRRLLSVTMALAAASLIAGCAYDPYTGAYVPCCNYYGYGYRYPTPYYNPYGYPPRPAPYVAPPQYQQPGYVNPPPYGGPGAAVYPDRMGPLEQRFAAANIAGDGRLTPEQASAGMPVVAENFYAIDTDGKGYVTLPEVQAFMAQQRAERGRAEGMAFSSLAPPEEAIRLTRHAPLGLIRPEFVHGSSSRHGD